MDVLKKTGTFFIFWWAAFNNQTLVSTKIGAENSDVLFYSVLIVFIFLNLEITMFSLNLEIYGKLKFITLTQWTTNFRSILISLLSFFHGLSKLSVSNRLVPCAKWSTVENSTALWMSLILIYKSLIYENNKENWA